LAVISIAQHHGYPTPLLDWSESPYIAAYFAVREFAEDVSPRVYCLNRLQVLASVDQVTDIGDPRPTLTVLKPKPFMNPRALPQQAVTTFTNVDDIENFLVFKASGNRSLFVRHFDFDAKERASILDELEWMGITDSVLFPSMDGSFRTLARRKFPR
jgi:hypothetical protein